MSGDRTVRGADDARRSGRSVRHATAGPGRNRLAVVHHASWFLFVLFIPLIGVLVYLIARGGSIHERSVW